MDMKNIRLWGKSVRLEKYGKYYNESAFWKKLNSMPNPALVMILEKILLLHELLLDRETPCWVKVVLIATLGYVISPVDLIPDIIPIAGFLDDIAVVALVLGNLQNLITDDIKQRAEECLNEPLEAQPTRAQATA